MTAVSPAARLVRGTLAAAVSTLAASASHGMADGAALFTLGTLVALCLATPFCVALAGRELSLRRLSVAVILSQTAFHGLFRLLGHGPHPAHGAHGAHAPHAAHAAHAAHTPEAAGSHLSLHAGHNASIPLPEAGTGAMEHHSLFFDGNASMALSHLAAALATIAVLRQGEQALALVWRLLALVLPALPVAPRAVVVGPQSARPVHFSPQPLTDLGLVLSGVGRRAPPLIAAAV
ncbi:hypothetical protein [Arthrobacter sp. UM1]|uniref:hypothetical protein n=1 Tax=Arthrobacter sp. UM1 TaxID=2766776 RepID=UPI001CF626C0|nr:hypothetical protein [Arthrobacter sp. UM1]MCB4207407.1 hypothetical protein [Arthrobacter sp. UM1]